MKREELGLCLKRAGSAFSAAKSRALSPFDLTISQYSALCVLNESPGAPCAEVARRCQITPQAITGVLNNLEERKLIERRKASTNRILREVFLTDDGKSILDNARAAAFSVDSLLVRDLDPGEVDFLVQLLKRCSTNVLGSF